MKIRLLFTLAITFRLTSLFGQDATTHLKENAIKIDHLDTLGKPVYDRLAGFKLFMVGEMHGTNEPANFLVGLSELFANFGDTVQVGFEIPSEQMIHYSQSSTDNSVFQSDFFAKNSVDGRASTAWANAITRLAKNSRVQIFFYDINTAESTNYNDNDSLMYLKIKDRIIKHPSWRTITLSGNIHNMRLKFREKPTTGYYLCNDKELNLADKICTLNHYYQSGTMLNNIGKGLELRHVNKNSTIYSETFPFDSYLYIFHAPNTYNGVFFTRTVTAAHMTYKSK